MHEKTEKVIEKYKKIRRTLTGKPVENVEVSETGKNIDKHQQGQNVQNSLDNSSSGQGYKL